MDIQGNNDIFIVMKYLIIWFSGLFVIWVYGCKSTPPTVSENQSPSRTVVNQPDRNGSANLDPATRQRIDSDFIEACTQMMRADYQGAINLFEQVVSADPSNHAAMYNIARLSVEFREYDKAIEYAIQALDMHQENAWYYHTLGNAYELKGDYNRAIETYQRLVKKFPSRTQAYLHLAELLTKVDRTDEALKQLEEVEKRNGLQAEVSMKRYQLLSKQNLHEEAIKIVEALITENPEEPQFYQMQYESWMALQNETAAVQTLENLLKVDPQNGFALLTLADYYKKRNELDKSDTYLFAAFSNPEIDPAGKIQLIENLLPFADQTPEIIPRLKRLSRIFSQTHPGSARSLSIQGKMLDLEGKSDSARMYYREAIEQDPNQTKVWLDLLETSFKNKHYSQLNKDAEEALEFYPNQVKFLYYFGLSASILKDYPAAVYALEKIKKINPDEPVLLTLTLAELAHVYQQQGKSEKATEFIEEAFQRAPKNPYVLEQYGNILFLQGKKEPAMEKWKEAIKAGATFRVEDKLKEQ